MIASLETFAIRLPRDAEAVTGTAGTPTAVEASPFDYRWSSAYPVLYAVNFETALFKVTTDSGMVGWGEAQAPLAPEIACLIAELLLRPAIVGEPFDGTPTRIADLWRRMYSTMRVRGQTGGFMLDAISGVDLALWDVAGKMQGKPAASLIGAGRLPQQLPAYHSGLAGVDNAARLLQAHEAWQQGFRTFKLFYDRSEDELFDLIDRLRAELPGVRIAVDALWRLDEQTAAPFTRKLDERRIFWLECPLPPEEPEPHTRLARAVRTPVALGESYRTHYELSPFLGARIPRFVQPDLGRCGITEGLEIASRAAEAGAEIVPHVSIAMGPQIAAALHFAAAVPHCPLVEFNPRVFEVANRFLETPLEAAGGAYRMPQAPGLGIAVKEDAVRQVASNTR